jgi:signal transduction histidine kinase/ActR/RegA family two-component response regulator
VWIATATQGVIFANQSFVEYTGHSPTYGSTVESIVHENDRARLAGTWRDGVGRGTSFEAEIRIKRFRDGAHRWHLLRMVPLLERQEQTGEWLGTLTDVEEQKRNEEIIRQKQKLEGLGLLAGGIAHDFNNLLVGIMGGASYSLETVSKDHPAREMLETILRASERAADLVRQLLAYAGKGTAPVESVNLAQLVRDTTTLLRATIPRPVQLMVEIDEKLPMLRTNSAQMQQLIVNLIVNAAEAIGESSGVVTVQATLRNIDVYPSARNVLGSELAPGAYAQIEVTDTGCGMDEATRARVFDPIFTTKLAGRGLGLAAVQGIVRSAQGSMEVISAPGKGSTFRILLPVLAQSGLAAEATSAPLPPESGAGRQVLIIDDEKVVRDIATKILQTRGYSVLTAEGGRSGLEIFSKKAGAISLVLLDQSMPGMSGVEVLQRLKEVNPQIPVAMISGYSEADMAKQLRDLPSSGYIQKPFTAGTLLAKVRQLMEESGHADRERSHEA